MTRSLGFVLSVLLVAGCSLLPKPPNPTPTPTPIPPPVCEDLGVPGCHETSPPLTCGQCWHQPPGEECPIMAPACPTDPLPEPQCQTFTDRGGTFMPRSGQCDCYFDRVWLPCDEPPPSTGCAEETNLISTTCFEQEFAGEVKLATDTLGDLTGNDPKANLDALAEQLRLQMPGRCVISGIEAIFIVRDDGKYEENHAVFFGNGGWTNNGFGKYIGCHANVTPGEPPPTQPPPTDGVCVDPDPTGLPAEFNMKHHNQDWDTTYRVKGYDYCTAAGFTNRGTCPLRNEGDPEREECEEKHIGVQQWWCDGTNINSRSCDVFEDDCVTNNPAQAKCHGHAKTCTQDGATCSEADW